MAAVVTAVVMIVQFGNVYGSGRCAVMVMVMVMVLLVVVLALVLGGTLCCSC